MPAENTVYVSIELSVSSWLVAARLPGVEKSRLRRLEGGDATALLKTIADLQLKASAKLGCAADVACCFEAGRDGLDRLRRRLVLVLELIREVEDNRARAMEEEK